MSQFPFWPLLILAAVYGSAMAVGPSPVEESLAADAASDRPWSQIPVILGEPLPAIAGEAGVDRFHADMSRITTSQTPDGVVIVHLNGEGVEHTLLVPGSDGRPVVACASILKVAGRSAPLDFRHRGQPLEHGHALR